MPSITALLRNGNSLRTIPPSYRRRQFAPVDTISICNIAANRISRIAVVEICDLSLSEDRQ
jgi:hypothetical protein